MPKSKIITAITLFIFFVVTSSVIVAGILSRNNNSTQNISPTPSVTDNTTAVEIELTNDVVSKHSESSDCWMIIFGNVYNLTSYVSQHPGGSIMVPYCGKDGSNAFQTKEGKGTHSNLANNLLASYLLGKLNSSITIQDNSGNPSANTSSNPIPTSTDNEDYEEEDN